MEWTSLCFWSRALTQENLATEPVLQHTPLHSLHIEQGAKMVPFAGYDMPVQYGLGVLGEHLHTSEKAGLFDVSHMGQARLMPVNPKDDAAAFFEHQVAATYIENVNCITGKTSPTRTMVKGKKDL